MFQSISKRFDPIPVLKDRTSETVPDMSFTPREIIQKFSRGEKVPLGFKGQFDCEDDINDDKYKYEPSMDPGVLEDDPTRDPQFDFGDFVEEQHALNARARASARKRVKGEQSAKRKASAEEPSAKRGDDAGDD